MKKCILILMVVLIMGCVVTGVVNGEMWGATDPPVVPTYETTETTENHNGEVGGETNGSAYSGNGSNDTPATQKNAGSNETATGNYPQVDGTTSNENKPDYEGRFIMTAKTAKTIGHRDRTYFLTMNSDGTFTIRTDYQVDGEYEYELHSGTYKAESDKKINMTLTTFETSIGENADKDKYADAKTVSVTFKDNILSCKQGKKKYEFEKLM